MLSSKSRRRRKSSWPLGVAGPDPELFFCSSTSCVLATTIGVRFAPGLRTSSSSRYMGSFEPTGGVATCSPVGGAGRSAAEVLLGGGVASTRALLLSFSRVYWPLVEPVRRSNALPIVVGRRIGGRFIDVEVGLSNLTKTVRFMRTVVTTVLSLKTRKFRVKCALEHAGVKFKWAAKPFQPSVLM